MNHRSVFHGAQRGSKAVLFQVIQTVLFESYDYVGGPVDVTVKTKGDGFVWIKRKHYFSADINHHYFERQEI